LALSPLLINVSADVSDLDSVMVKLPFAAYTIAHSLLKLKGVLSCLYKIMKSKCESRSFAIQIQN
jgi:hypothetical protein